MFTDEQRSIVKAVLEKKQQDPFCRPSPEETAVINEVLQTSMEEQKVVEVSPSYGSSLEQ